MTTTPMFGHAHYTRTFINHMTPKSDQSPLEHYALMLHKIFEFELDFKPEP